MTDLDKSFLAQRQTELDRIKYDYEFKDCRFVTNAELEAHLKKIFDLVMSKLGPKYKIRSHVISIAVNLEKIGETISLLPFIFEDEYKGEIIIPIFFEECDNIEDVINAFTEGPAKFKILKPYMREYKKSLDYEYGFAWCTFMLIDKIEPMMHNPEKGDLLFNIITPKNIKEGKYIVFQKNDELKTRIMIDISNVYDIKLFDPNKVEEGIFHWILQHLCFISQNPKKKRICVVNQIRKKLNKLKNI